MKNRIKLTLTGLLAATLLAGCGMRTVDQMYAPPKRSEAYSHVQSAMDMAMIGLEFSAPVAGENQQTVQLADLSGDGVDEYIVYAKGASEKPLNILIFSMNEEGACFLTEVIEFNGSAFERVEYVDVDDHPGKEIVVGRQISNQLMGTVCVYSFATGQAERLMNTSYSNFITCDLDQDHRSEVLVFQPGEAASAQAVAHRYQFENGTMERSIEVETSVGAEDIRRIVPGKLQGGTPAIYLSGVTEGNAIVTDIFALRQDRLVNLTAARSAGNSVSTLRNYYVYADDVDNDGVIELPRLITGRSGLSLDNDDSQYPIRWYSMDLQGREWDKMYTFHDYTAGWYIQLDSSWGNRLSVEQDGSTYTFYLWSEDGSNAQTLFKVYALTGSDREEKATQDGRFVLHRKEGTVFAAKMGSSGGEYGVTEEYLINSFHPIYQDWNTGET